MCETRNVFAKGRVVGIELRSRSNPAAPLTVKGQAMYTPDAEGRVEIRTYLAFLRRRWWLLLFGPVLAGFAAVMITGRMPKTYSATSTVLVNKTTAPGSQEYYDALLSQQLTNTYAQLVTR